MERLKECLIILSGLSVCACFVKGFSELFCFLGSFSDYIGTVVILYLIHLLMKHDQKMIDKIDKLERENIDIQRKIDER